jgi:hypothetical protein
MAVIVPLVSTFNAAGVVAAQKSLGTLAGALGRIGIQAAVATTAFKALNGTINFFSDSVLAARDLERNMAAVNKVFGSSTSEMKDFIETSSQFGLSQVDSARTVTYLGSVLKQAGFEMTDVSSNTQKLTILAQDLATTFGYDTSEALTAMTALFRGEYDPIEKFGVALKQNEVNALVAAKGLGKLTGQELLNAQQQVRLEQLYLRSRDAMGAFAAMAGTLYVEQQKLNAEFKNMQSTLGETLKPAITEITEILTRELKDGTGQLSAVFEAFNEIIEALTPILAPIIELLGTILGAFAQLVKVLEPLINLIGASMAVAIELAVDLFRHLGQAVDDAWSAFEAFFEGMGVNVGDDSVTGEILTWIREFINESVILSTVLSPILKIIDRIAELTDQQSIKKYTDAVASAERNRAALRAQAKAAQAEGAGGAVTATGDKKTTKKQIDYIKEFYKDISEEIRKQQASLKLQALGASEGLIQSIIGSGEGWEKVFLDVIKAGEKGIKDLQARFSRTDAGMKEIFEANKKFNDEATRAYDEAKQKYDDAVESLKAFRDEIKESMRSLIPTEVLTREIGEFERQVLDTFADIEERIRKALGANTILADGASALSAYAAKEKIILAGLARQRDELIAKRTLAESIVGDVRQALTSVANLTSMIQQIDVEVVTTKIIDNLSIATKKTVKEFSSGQGLVGGLQSVLDKTKRFATQLKALRELGLDSTLFKQIVDAGADAGGATAEEIIKGGSESVRALNSTFAELESVTAVIAEDTAKVMLDSGKEITSALVAGLLAEEQQLVDTATALATAFTTAFNAQMANLVVPVEAPTAPVLKQVEPIAEALTLRLGDIKKMNFEGASPEAAALANKLIASPKFTAWGSSVTINVNAGMGTDGTAVGQAVYAELKKYANANGIKF